MIKDSILAMSQCQNNSNAELDEVAAITRCSCSTAVVLECLDGGSECFIVLSVFSHMLCYVVQAYELFSHEADTGMVIPAASRLKNVEWDTQTTLFCWASQGVWPPQADGTEVT